MPVFKNKEEMIEIISAALEMAFADEEFSRKIHEAGLVMRYNYFEPECSLLVDTRQLPVKWGFEAGPVETNLEFRFSGDTAHEFFLGRMNVPVAIATRKIVFRGQVSKALKLMPIVKPLYTSYREVLKKMGRTDLLEETEARERAPVKKGGRRGIFQKKPKVDYAAADALYRPGAVPIIEGENTRDVTTPGDVQKEGPELYREMLEKMLLVRTFEQHLADSFRDATLPTFAVHVSIGQEAIAAGLLALRKTDVINTTHRGHGHMIVKGADLKGMMAELYGKSAGTCGGKGGSMHIIDDTVGIMGSNGIVGAGIVLGAGAGLSAKLLGEDRVSVALFGDGASNQGMFHEGLNLAAVKKLPVVFIIENNEYAEFTPLVEHAGESELWKRAAAYGMEGKRVDGNDARAVFREIRAAAEKARGGGGPALLEMMTYRWHGHMEGDEEKYRTEEEKRERMKLCPIERLKRELINEGVLKEEEFVEMKNRAEAAVKEALEFALESQEPKPDELYTHVYAPDRKECYEGELFPKGDTRDVTVSQAINEAIAHEMRCDGAVFLMGEDVALGGYMSVTVGLVEEFGKGKVIDTPISENAIVGGGVGAAVNGARPIVEIMFTDFVTTCMDPIVNQAAKLHYMSGGRVSVPMVVRMPSGGGLGMAAQHSQSLETMLAGMPGLTVVAPSDPHTASGLLSSAIRSSNPVVFVEHKLLYMEVGPVMEGGALVPLRKSRVVREGKDITLVSYSYGVCKCREAAKRLSAVGIEAEIVDLLTLYPMDIEPVLRSIEKTGRLIVVEEDTLSMGIGAEVLARVAECAWGVLEKPPRRLAGKEVPMPYSNVLEQMAAPSEEDIYNLSIEII